METTNYTSIGPVLQLNKAGELIQKRMKAVKVCDGLYITEPDKSNFVRFIIECNGVMWVESTQSKSYAERYAAAMPEALKKVKAGFYSGENRNNYCREIDRRINHPYSPAIMDLKKPERKKPAPLAENERKVSVYMFKGCTDEMTEKNVVITEVAPHVYTYTYKLKKYGERVKIIFEIDGVYFQGSDNGAHIMEREDFTEVCTKAYEHARENVADGAAKGMAYLIEVQKRIDAATPEQVDAPEVSAPQYDTTAEVAAKIMAYLTEVCKWQDDGDRTNALILKFMQPANAYHGFNGSDFVELAGLIGFTIEKKWRDRITKYVHTFQAHRARSCPQQSGVYGDMYTRPRHDTMTEIYTIADAFMRRLLWLLERRSENQPATPAETPRISTETAEMVNVSTEDEKEAERAENKPTATEVVQMVKTELAKNKAMHTAWHLEFPDGTECNIRHKCTVVGCDCYEYTEVRNGEETFKDYKATERDITLYIYQRLDLDVIQPPQSPETPQTTERTTDTPKPRETARKSQNRGIGRASAIRHSGLGAGGYEMLDNASATLTAMCVPRECSTAAYW